MLTLCTLNLCMSGCDPLGSLTCGSGNNSSTHQAYVAFGSDDFERLATHMTDALSIMVWVKVKVVPLEQSCEGIFGASLVSS